MNRFTLALLISALLIFGLLTVCLKGSTHVRVASGNAEWIGEQ